MRQGFVAMLVNPGDWSVTVASSSRAEISLFYASVDGCLIASTSVKDVVRGMSVPAELDLAKMADLMALYDDPATTVYTGVERLPPGYRLDWSPDGGVTTSRWFRPEVAAATDVRRTDEAERMRETIRAAVAHSLPSEGIVAATLSGGLDSSMVTATAASLLGERGQLLHAATHVPLPGTEDHRPNWEADDGPYTREMVRCTPGIALTEIVNHSRVTPVEAQEALFPLSYLPTLNASNLVWVRDIQRWASNLGAAVLLTGSTGNAPFSRSSSGILSHMLQHADFAAVLRQIRARYRLHGALPAMRGVLGAAAPEWAHHARARLRGRVTDDEFSFAREMPLLLDRLSRGAREQLESFESPSARITHQDWVDFVLHDTSLMHVPQSVSNGVWWSDPLSDPEVVTLALSLPDEAWVRDGRDRSLARRAAKGLVPDSIRLRTTRGEQSADVGLWMQGKHSQYHEVIDRISNSPLAREFIDVTALRRSLAGGLPSPGQAAANWDITHGRAVGFGLFACWWEEERMSLLARPKGQSHF